MSNESNSNGQQSESNRPAMTFRYGAIKCTVWKNQTRNGPMYNTSVTRSYKDGENWRDSSSFGSEDLPTVAKAFLDAHTWVQEQKASDREEGKHSEPQQSKQPRKSRESARV